MNKILNSDTLNFMEAKLVEKLSGYALFQNPQINCSPRAIGDTVQEIIGETLPSCFPEGVAANFNSAFARRAMEDVAFYDSDENYYAVDIKTHNESTHFNMPNLISVERLSRFYKNEKQYFVILLIDYNVIDGHLTFTRARLIPIEHLDWSCLTIGALGWGQIQIANSNIVSVNRNSSRIDWMLSLCDAMDQFYPREIDKINERMDYFRSVRTYWEDKISSAT